MGSEVFWSDKVATDDEDADISYNEELDTEWIDDFLTKEKLYAPFYKNKIENIRTIFIYINENNEIIHSKKFRSPIKNETFTRDQLITNLKQNMLYNNHKFYPLHLLKFNITLNQNEINDFNQDPSKFNFFNEVEYVHDIIWKRTIQFFHPLNSIYIIMKKRVNNNNRTKKIYIRTKKKHKKTRRKYI